ncbi:Hypothetical predicted protein [Mytilus galloprovincialis]|uniref:Integrase catalytic domain-containing protein n=1 Tax=Mytilus galloprovincialis TaxID=29158 RepID=A0A8B6FFC4_MYTGA|nr:Hypothetical predicted protein [Mytilus galloprovincialis]
MKNREPNQPERLILILRGSRPRYGGDEELSSNQSREGLYYISRQTNEVPSDGFVDQNNCEVTPQIRNTSSVGTSVPSRVPLSVTTKSVPSSMASTNLVQTNVQPPAPRHVSFNHPKPRILRREREPDKFDGKSVDWQDYIVHFEQTAQWNDWDDESKAQQLCMCLRGTAQKLLGDAKSNVLADYTSLKDMLSKRFAPKERITAYRCEFNSRIRRKSESIQDYGYALRRLVRLAYPDLEKTEDLAIDQFIRGLGNFDVQKRVQFSHPTTLESAIALAIEYEAFVGSMSTEVRKPKEQTEEHAAAIQSVKRSDKNDKGNTENVKAQSDLSEVTRTIMNCFEQLSKKIEEINKTIPLQCTKCNRVRNPGCGTQIRPSIKVNPIKQNGLFASVKVGLNKGSFLLDTGAVVSCVSKAKLDEFNIDELKVQDILTSLTTAGGQELKVHGQVTLEFFIQGIPFTHDFVIAELDDLEGILGIDFLEANEAQINISKSLLIMPDDSTIKLHKQQNKHCALIRLSDRLVLPANTESVFQIKVPKNIKEEDMLVEPNARLVRNGILISTALVNTTKRKVAISAINCRDRDVTLKRNKVVGSIQTVKTISDSVSVNKLNNLSELPEHLTGLIDRVSSKMTESQKQDLSKLVIKYQDIFLGPDGKLGKTDIVRHTIDTGNTKPVKIPPRRVPIKQREIIEQELEKMLQNDVIEPSCSPWSAPVTLCLKKDSTWRFSPIRPGNSDLDETIPYVEDDSDNEGELELPQISNWLRVWTSEEKVSWQDNDPDISKIVNMLGEFDEKPGKEVVSGCSYGIRNLWSVWESLLIENGLLYYRIETDNGENLVLVAPTEIRNQIMKEFHNSVISGHLGRDRTIRAIKNRFYWPGMTSDISSWVRECIVCAKAKPGPGVGRFPLQQSLVGCPFDRIGVDIVGPCPITENENEYLIVVQDYFTKWTEAFAVKNHNALTVADKLVSEIFCRFGMPLQIHSDQGREFESILFQAVCDKLGIDKTRTTPYRPQSDGLVERFNRTLQKMLSMFVNKFRNNWDDLLPYLLMAYRATENDSTGVSPHKMLTGREMVYPLDIMAGNPSTVHTPCPVEYVQWLNYSFRKTFNFAREKLSKAATRQKKSYDRGLKPRQYEENDFVFRWYPPTAGIKLGLGWRGPYKVKAKLSDVTYRIQETPTAKDIVVHVDHLKPHFGNVPVTWLPPEIEDEIQSDESDIEPPLLDFHLSFDETHETENDIPLNIDVNPCTPSPRRTRCGRTVKKPTKYSPCI